MKLVDTEKKRTSTDVEGAASGCSVATAVICSCGKYKLIPILYTDTGDNATATNVDKT